MMTHRYVARFLLPCRTLYIQGGCGSNSSSCKKVINRAMASHSNNANQRSDEEWKKVLTEEQFRVTRLKGTELPYTGEYNKNFKAGEYLCVCCGTLLFGSENKFDSGCGWPAFHSTKNPSAVSRHADDSLDMMRVEITCANCQAHLGHVFEDGPKPTGERYCVNSASLKFLPKK